MQKVKVVEYYGGISKAASALGVTHSAISQWGDVIPEKQAMRLERLTKGALRYEPGLYLRNHNPKPQAR